MIEEVNKYIESTDERNYPEETMFGMKKNRMYVFYNMDHYTKDNRDFMISSLINVYIGKYHMRYNVEFVDAKANKVVIKKVRRNASPAKLRLAQMKANRELKAFLSHGTNEPKF
jgi:hypothetical protein